MNNFKFKLYASLIFIFFLKLFCHSQYQANILLKYETHDYLNKQETATLFKIIQLHKSDGFFVGQNISLTKLSSAISECIVPGDEEILGLIDATTSGNAKNCLLIGTSGLYINNAWRSKTPGRYFIPYEKLLNLSIKKAGMFEIAIGEFTFDMSGSEVKKEFAINILKELQNELEKIYLQKGSPAADNNSVRDYKLPNNENPIDGHKVTSISDVDINIPENKNGTTKVNSYALIIGNEDYSSFQTDINNEINVDYAVNDAQIFKEYLIKTIGIPEKNITLKANATLGQMQQAISKLVTIAQIKKGEAELIFYYAGHGFPDEKTGEPYIIPVDISGSNITSGIRLNDLYSQLTQFPVKNVTVFLDACFSGGARNQPLLAVRGIKIPPKEGALNGNIVVFSSSLGEESSGLYKEKQHGMFTYFLLKMLQETDGNITYKELSEYLFKKVQEESLLINDKLQTPQTHYSDPIKDEWGKWRLK